MADPALTDTITSAAKAYGVDPQTLLQIAQVESGGNPNAANPNSSASGLFQFTKGTAAQYGLSDPSDPAASADAAARLTRDNAATLSKAGVDTTPGNLYLAHFAGAGTAAKLLTADPSAAAADVLGPAAVKANPFPAKMSVSDLRNWAGRKMGGGADPSGAVAPSTAPAPGPAAAPVSGMLSGSAALQPQPQPQPQQQPEPQPAMGAAPAPAAMPQQAAAPQLQPAQPLRMPPLPPGLLRARLLASLLPSQRG